MEWSQIAELAPAKLAQLLDVEHDIEWSEQYPADILRYQLAATLLPDLLLIPGADAAGLQLLIRARPPGETFLQHLTSEQPSLAILTAIKSFARHIKDNVSNPMHGDPATILYFATIASALVHCRAYITSLTKQQLRDGFEWTIDQPGAREMRSFLTIALQVVSCD